MKVCSKCKVEKELTEFVKDKYLKDGLKSNCKKCTAIYSKKYYEENKERLKEFTFNNKEKKSKYNKEHYLKNKDKKRNQYLKNKANKSEYGKKYYKENKDKIIEYGIKWQNKKIKEDYLFRFSRRLRSLVRTSFKRGVNQYSKKAKTENILGCTIKEFIDYISLKFTEGMTLENYGKWHLDHIIPISSAKTEEEIIKLNHHTNFQPLWAEDNLRKGTKY